MKMVRDKWVSPEGFSLFVLPLEPLLSAAVNDEKDIESIRFVLSENLRKLVDAYEGNQDIPKGEGEILEEALRILTDRMRARFLKHSP